MFFREKNETFKYEDLLRGQIQSILLFPMKQLIVTIVFIQFSLMGKTQVIDTVQHGNTVHISLNLAKLDSALSYHDSQLNVENNAQALGVEAVVISEELFCVALQGEETIPLDTIVPEGKVWQIQASQIKPENGWVHGRILIDGFEVSSSENLEGLRDFLIDSGSQVTFQGYSKQNSSNSSYGIVFALSLLEFSEESVGSINLNLDSVLNLQGIEETTAIEGYSSDGTTIEVPEGKAWHIQRLILAPENAGWVDGRVDLNGLQIIPGSSYDSELAGYWLPEGSQIQIQAFAKCNCAWAEYEVPYFMSVLQYSMN